LTTYLRSGGINFLRSMRYLQKIIDRPDVHLVYLPQESKNVYIDIFVKTGRLHEPESKVGIGHVMDHYINGSLYAKYLDRLNTNAWISQEHLHFHLATSLAGLPRDAKRFFDGVLKPHFDNEELFLFERQAIVNELKSDFASVASRQAELVARHRFRPGAPYARSTIREADNVLRLHLDDLKHHHQRFFTRGNTTIFVAAHKPPRKLFGQLFGLLKSYDLAEGEPPPYPLNRYDGFKVACYPEEGVEGAQHVSLSFPGLSYADSVEERIALNIFCRVFTGLSRHGVFQELRKAGIYAIDYGNTYHCRFGLVNFWATIPPARLTRYLDIVSDSLHRFKDEPLSRHFLRTRLQTVRERTRNAWKNNNDLYNWIMEYILDEGSVRTPKEVFASLQNLTPEFLQQLVSRVFVKSKASLVISGEPPRESIEELAGRLKF
jgi:predicted Zn-dependent peptidase